MMKISTEKFYAFLRKNYYYRKKKILTSISVSKALKKMSSLYTKFYFLGKSCKVENVSVNPGGNLIKIL